MSIIAVEGLNPMTSLHQVGEMLSKSIPGPFEPLNFTNFDQKPFKTCLIKLSDTLDPVEVIEKINKVVHGKRKSLLNAYVPDDVQNISVVPAKRKKTEAPKDEMTASRILVIAHNEIMKELQYKYTGLYELSSKGNHTLLEAIGMTVLERLTQLMANKDEHSASSFKLTARYRKAHPHFGDFQLILGSLHRLEDAAGAPRTQLQEAELMQLPKDINVVEDVPYSKARGAIAKYSEKILKKLEEHVDSYELAESPEDSPEEAARKKVRAALTKMMPYMPAIMKQVVANHFSEDCKRNKCLRMRMYGEPYLPGKEATLPLLRRLGAGRAARWRGMYNLLAFDLPLDRYPRLVDLDGTTIAGCKVIIRCSSAPLYRVSRSLDQLEKVDLDDDEGEDIVME